MRSNNRSRKDIRDVSIKTDFIKYAEGSCLFEIGATRVICTVSVEDGVPHFLRGTSSGWITSEYAMIPRSCKERVVRESSKGKKTGRTQEIQRLIGRSLRAVVDLKALGERTIWVDCDVIQADGGTRCASITGSFIALSKAMEYLKEKDKISTSPIKSHVAAVSVGMVDGQIFLDLDYKEDSDAEVDMNIVMTGSGEFIEIQGTAEKTSFSKDEMDEMIAVAEKGIKKLINIQKKALEGDI